MGGRNPIGLCLLLGIFTAYCLLALDTPSAFSHRPYYCRSPLYPSDRCHCVLDCGELVVVTAASFQTACCSTHLHNCWEINIIFTIDPCKLDECSLTFIKGTCNAHFKCFVSDEGPYFDYE